MGARAHYSFKFKNQYINNVYQHWGDNNDFAISMSKELFNKIFLDMNEVVDFIIKQKFLDLPDLLLKIRNYDEEYFYDSIDQKEFLIKVLKEKNIFADKLEKIDYSETYLEGNFQGMKIHGDIDASYLFDLDQKILFDNFDNSKLFSAH